MRILRSVAAVASGLGFLAATVRVGALLATVLVGTPQRSDAGLTAYLFLNLVICGAGAILGGWLAARIASFAPYAHAAVMAAIVAVLSVGTATGVPAAGSPSWYPSVLGLVAVFGVLLGGKLRAAASTGPVVA
jgi:hypothetical protein